jgi:hypothetical protein
MVKRLLFAVTILLAACSTVSPTSVPTPSAEHVEQEQAAVYAAALEGLYGASSYVLISTTGTDPTDLDSTDQTLDYVLQNLHDVAAETVEDFRERNGEATPLRSDLDLGTPYSLLSRAEMSAMFSQNQDGWRIFYDRFPEAPGITTVSRVGFNLSLDQALVYVGTQSHWLAGAGYYLLLLKVNGTWVIDQQVMTWIS